MKIMIGGGYDESASPEIGDQPVVTFVKYLAEQVIEQGHELRSGNLSSLDKVAIEAACAKAESLGKDPETVVVSYVPEGADARVICGDVKESSNPDWSSVRGRRPRVPEPIWQSDVLILVGGFGDASGTFTAAYWAQQTGTPVLPVATFGLAAREIFQDLPEGPEVAKITGLTPEDISTLTTASVTLNEPEKFKSYAEKIVSLSEKAALSRDAFVIMSFEDSDDMNDYLDAVSDICKEIGFDAVRTDTRPSTNSHQIIDAIHSAIETSGFVIADLTNQKPNVYYEIGYAKGLSRKLILTAKRGEEVHFDLQGYSRIEWTGTRDLKTQLRPVLRELAAEFGLKSASD